MIRTTYAIIEDEEDAKDLLKSILDKHCPELLFLGTEPTVAGAKDFLKNNEPDILFADIHLKDGNIFQLLENLDSFNFKLIFTTAYDTYALQAFDYQAIHYLLKPFDSDDVINAVRRVPIDVNLKDKVYNIISQFNGFNENDAKRIGIATTSGIKMITVRDIVRVEADRSYCRIFLEDGSTLLASKSLGEIENQINSKDFFRTHLSHLVNLSQVSSYEKSDGGYLRMNEGSVVPVSRRKKKEIIRLLIK